MSTSPRPASARPAASAAASDSSAASHASRPSTLRPNQWSDVQPTALTAAGVSARDTLAEEWVYKDRSGKEVFRVMGFEAPNGRRRCRAVHPLGEAWCPGEGDGPLPLYRLEQLPAKGWVFVGCGEREADALAALVDAPAVASAFGAGFARRTDWTPLAGRSVVVLPGNDERGRAYAGEVTQILLALEPAARVRVVELPDRPRSGGFEDYHEDRTWRLNWTDKQVKDEMLERIKQTPWASAQDVAPAGPGPAAPPAEPVLTRLSEVTAEEVQWLWPGRVALGKLTLLFGDPGLGKSLLTLDMAARVTKGSAWPDGRGSAPAGSVVLVTAEDAKGDTVRARLDRAGADAARIVSLDEIQEVRPGGGAGVNGGAAVRRPFTLADWRELDRALEREGDVRLVVIDPVSAFLGDTGGNSNAAMRALLAPIAKVAERRRVAVVMVTHLTKGSGGKALHRAAGSLAFVAAARAAWLAVADPKDDKRTLLLPAKNNLSGDRGGLAYRTAGGAVTWETAEEVNKTADDAVAGGRRRRRGRPPVLRRKAVEWLRDRLAAGPVPVGDRKDPAPGTVFADAAREGMSCATVRRAALALGVLSDCCPLTRQSRWMLPKVVAGVATEAGGAGRRPSTGEAETANPDSSPRRPRSAPSQEAEEGTSSLRDGGGAADATRD